METFVCMDLVYRERLISAGFCIKTPVEKIRRERGENNPSKTQHKCAIAGW